tara:strand:- start:269 stop:853 length:585 start_codon:yes stop_codon:yes gene_type:complete
MIIEKLRKYDVILGSQSPRRKKLLKGMGLNFKIKICCEKENYPKDLKAEDIAKFIAKQKADFLLKELSGNYLLITVDTIVLKNNKLLNKPKNIHDAIRILKDLSGTTHNVISGVCIKSIKKEVIFSSITKVVFNNISESEINYYINKYKPYDKAGSYGIQEWIGAIGVKQIHGSFNNVVGLPTSELYQKLKLFI